MIVDFGKYQSFQLARTWVIYLHGFTEIRDRGGVGGQFNVTQFVRKRALGKPNAEALSAKIIAKLPWEGLGGLEGCESGWIAKIQGTAVSRCAVGTQHPTLPTSLLRYSLSQDIHPRIISKCDDLFQRKIDGEKGHRILIFCGDECFVREWISSQADG